MKIAQRPEVSEVSEVLGDRHRWLASTSEPKTPSRFYSPMPIGSSTAAPADAAEVAANTALCHAKKAGDGAVRMQHLIKPLQHDLKRNGYAT